jgi:hypothetical protein
MKKTATIILGLAMTLVAGFLYADEGTSFRCGSDLILIDYTMYQIRNSCGAPDSEQVIGEREVATIGQRGVTRFHTEPRDQNKSVTTVYITEWTYIRDFGIYILTFEGSRLIKKEFKRLN